MKPLDLNSLGRGRREASSRSTPFLVMVTKNSPRAGRARLLQGENYV